MSTYLVTIVHDGKEETCRVEANNSQQAKARARREYPSHEIVQAFRLDSPVESRPLTEEQKTSIPSTILSEVTRYLDKNGHGRSSFSMIRVVKSKFRLPLQQATWLVKAWIEHHIGKGSESVNAQRI